MSNIIIPNSVTSIESGAFRECTSLCSINIPEGVKIIAFVTFDYCINLTDVTLPQTTEIIEASAFWGCKNLGSIKIPANTSIIGSGAFYSCPKLKTIYIYPLNPPTLTSGSHDAFDKNLSGRKFHVPTASADAYKTAEKWSKYAGEIVGDL